MIIWQNKKLSTSAFPLFLNRYNFNIHDAIWRRKKTMLIDPKEILALGPLWVTEQINPYFIMQRRKGRSGRGGLSAIIVGTIDAVRETKPAPYRILHQAEGSEVFLVVSQSMTNQEVQEDWHFFERELLPTLADFETPEEATEFIKVKVKSARAVAQDHNGDMPATSRGGNSIPDSTVKGMAALSLENHESLPYKHASDRFKKLFPTCQDENLVEYYSCSLGTAIHRGNKFKTYFLIFI